LKAAVDCVRERFPQIKMTGIGMDFSSTLDLPFNPGSSIGHFTPEEAVALLSRVREACCTDGGLLIGVIGGAAAASAFCPRVLGALSGSRRLQSPLMTIRRTG
jgi:uncharacterized SAM-dependent methyltransferase